MARIALKQSDDIFKDIITPLSSRGTSPFVYFCRIIGCENELQYTSDLIRLDEKFRQLGNNYIYFDQAIPLTTDQSSIEKVRKLFDQVSLNDFSNGVLLDTIETKGYFLLSSDTNVDPIVKEAFSVILNLYFANGRPTNLSIAINFITKILLWFLNFGKHIPKKSDYNLKIVYWGSPKTHEIYFLILMSLLGSDILVINTSFNDRFTEVDKENTFSFFIKKEKEFPIGVFPIIQRSQTKPQPQPRLDHPPKSEKMNDLSDKINDHFIVVKLKKTENIFEDILLPINQRSGFVGEPYPILPAYFTRYIGSPGLTDNWEAEYFNSLYNLDKALLNTESYLKFLEGIPTPSAAESSLIPPEIIKYQYKDKLEIIEHILQAKILHRTHNALLDNSINKTFVEIVNLFIEKGGNTNLSLILNFSLKLVIWFNRYLPQLYVDPFSNKKPYNPKILFYGTIKPHEIYLLNAFHTLGGDVLFIHPHEEGDKAFQLYDKEVLLTQLIKNQYNLPFVPFPQEEQLIRRSTVAYNASKEIEEVIYNEEVGLFKPWQFESYSTQPITLKTTYDELKILWREPAKIRPEFKVQNKKVYVPNLFAKINGVNENIMEYWQDIKALASAPYTKLIEDVPFTKICYTKQELYQADFLLNEKGIFAEEKVLNSKHFRFGYLKAPLQRFLIQKINELLGSGMFVNDVDEKFKLKILMTILTMDDSLIRLIEVFDFPQMIPKLVIYDNKKEPFCEDDAILLAFLNLIGLDIVIFTPTNYQNIEQHLHSSHLDLHQLPLVKYDLTLPPLSSVTENTEHKPGLLSRFFMPRR